MANITIFPTIDFFCLLYYIMFYFKTTIKMGKVANVGFRTTDGQVCSVHFFKQASTVNLTGDCGNKCLFSQGDSEI